jgi:hypothetical protein
MYRDATATIHKQVQGDPQKHQENQKSETQTCKGRSTSHERPRGERRVIIIDNQCQDPPDYSSYRSVNRDSDVEGLPGELVRRPIILVSSALVSECRVLEAVHRVLEAVGCGRLDKVVVGKRSHLLQVSSSHPVIDSTPKAVDSFAEEKG